MTRRRLRPDSSELPSWQRWALYVTALLLLVSGALWLLAHYGLRVDTEFGPQPHPLEYATLQLHGAAAMLALVALGSLLPVHVQRGWQRRQNRGSGVLGIALFGVLALTGYLLYYFTTETTRPWLGAFHWVLGLAAVPALAWHALSGQRLRLRRRHQPHAATHSKAARTPADARLH